MQYKHVYKNAELFHLGVHRQLSDRPLDEQNARNSTGYVGFRAIDENTTRFYSYQRCLALLYHRQRVALISDTSRRDDIKFVPRWSHNENGDLIENPAHKIWAAHSFNVHTGLIRRAIPQDWYILIITNPEDGIDESTLRGAIQGKIDHNLTRALEQTNKVSEYERWLTLPPEEQIAAGRQWQPASPDMYMRAARESAAEWQRLATHMGWQSTVNSELDAESMERIEQVIAEREELRKKEEEQRKRALKREYRESKYLVKQWINCETNNFPYRFHRLGGPTLLRINGDRIETSHGAWFPVRHGALAFKVIMRQIAKGESWHANGKSIPMGHYKLTTIERKGDRKRDWQFIAGCHTLKLPQVMPIARKLELC